VNPCGCLVYVKNLIFVILAGACIDILLLANSRDNNGVIQQLTDKNRAVLSTRNLDWYAEIAQYSGAILFGFLSDYQNTRTRYAVRLLLLNVLLNAVSSGYFMAAGYTNFWLFQIPLQKFFLSGSLLVVRINLPIDMVRFPHNSRPGISKCERAKTQWGPSWG
jgi:hypothetical protein